MNRKILISLAVFVFAVGVVFNVRADSWALPEKRKYYSPDKKYYFEVTPKKLESQLEYFRDKVEGKENAGAAGGVKDNRAKGAFYARRAGGGYSRKWEAALVNEVSPVRALVSGSGRYVVTFDNWHSVGYGDDVVVIYNAQGGLIKKFGLEDLLTEGDIETFQRSVSSIHWGREHYIDESQGLLVLKIVSNGKSSWEESATYHELKIELATGRPLEPKRDLFPQPRVSAIVAAIQSTAAMADTVSEKPNCASPEMSFDATQSLRLSPEQTYAQATARPLPPYPAVAKVARAGGIVVVEVLISKEGNVLCARSISGHPLLRRAAVAAALNWKFEPSQPPGNATTAAGTVALEFKLEWKDMNPNYQLRN
jgi:TonB family protein